MTCYLNYCELDAVDIVRIRISKKEWHLAVYCCAIIRSYVVYTSRVSVKCHCERYIFSNPLMVFYSLDSVGTNRVWLKTAISLERQEKSLRTSSTAKFRNRRECAFKWQVSDMNCRLFYTVVLYQVGVSYLSSDSVLSSFISVRTFGSTAILFSQRSVMYKLLCSVQHSVYIYVWKV